MKYTFTLFTLLTSFVFGQYIKKATFIFDDDKKVEVKDVYVNDYIYEFKFADDPISLNAYSKDMVKEIIFDSIDFSREIPIAKETFYDNLLEDGIYETIEDFYKGVPTSTIKIKGKTFGEKRYIYSKDLMRFYDLSNNEKIISKPFAIVFENELFFNTKTIKQLESNNLKVGFKEISKSYIRVKYKNEKGYYTEISQPASNGYNPFMMYGAAGAIASTMVESRPIESMYHDIYPIFLMNDDKKFYGLSNCKRLNKNLPSVFNNEIKCDKNEDVISNIRKVIFEN